MPFFKFQSSRLDRFEFCNHLVDYKVQNYGIKRYANKPTFWFVSKKGFTLIELLVVMAIIAILATIMLANYNNFGARQEVKNAAAELKSNLRKYQTYALASQKNPIQGPATPNNGCNDTDPGVPLIVVDYYLVKFNDALRTYTASLHCIDEAGATYAPVPLPVVSLPDSITTMSSSCDEIRFKPLNYGVELCPGAAAPPSEVTITLSNSAGSYTVHVTSSGEIK